MSELRDVIGRAAQVCYTHTMKKTAICLSLFALAACASGHEPYQRASSPSALGSTVIPIEDNRLRVSYRAKDGETSRSFALLTAAEETLARGAEWFRVINASSDEEVSRGGGTSVSIGGATGSRGRSSVGVGVGIGFPIGGRSGNSVHGLEIIIGSGEQPDDPEVYDAAQVRDALLGAPVN